MDQAKLARMQASVRIGEFCNAYLVPLGFLPAFEQSYD
jgi:hypothetical protein